MAEVTINYKDAAIATMDASGTKTLQTQGKYCEDDIEVIYARPSGGGGDMYKLIDGTITDVDVDWTQVTALKIAAFRGCSLLTTVGNPTVSNLNDEAFRSCTGLVGASITSLSANSTYGTGCFRDCSNLESATVRLTASGSVSFAGNYCFSACPKLQTVILEAPNASALNLNFNWLLYNSNAVRNLVIRYNGVASLNVYNANAFGGIYNNPTESTIFVPQALISQYQQANNWSTMYAAGVTFAQIEGTVYDT